MPVRKIFSSERPSCDDVRMPVFDQSYEESVLTDEDGEDHLVLSISGCVVLGESRSARYHIRANVLYPFEYWVLELKTGATSGRTVLLLCRHEENGYGIMDHSEEDRELFPSYDPARTMTREQVFANNLKEEIFQFTDEICLCDTEVRAYHAHWIRQLFYHTLGPFYVSDALNLAPRLQQDEVHCEYFIEVEEEWQSVTWEELQQADPKEICSIMISREHMGTAHYHEEKAFPKGTRYYHESDTGGEGWHDEATQDEAELLDQLRELEQEKADLERQKSALLAEIDAVQREIMDPEMNWRLDALQQAQRENRKRLAQIEWRLQGVEQSIEKIIEGESIIPSGG